MCRADLRELIKAALFTGARFSELTGLHVLDVNVGAASIYIKPAKSGKGRYVPLSADGLNFFQVAILGKTKNALAFTKQDGAMCGKNQHSRALKEACAIAKLPPYFGFHELRHTYAIEPLPTPSKPTCRVLDTSQIARFLPFVNACVKYGNAVYLNCAHNRRNAVIQQTDIRLSD